VNAGRLNSRSGSIGSATRRSTTRNATSKAADPANSATMGLLPQPSSLPRTSASTSRNSAPLNVATPAQSMRVAFGSRLSRTFRYVIAIAITPIGTLR
jgi:hypothetical protein